MFLRYTFHPIIEYKLKLNFSNIDENTRNVKNIKIILSVLKCQIKKNKLMFLKKEIKSNKYSLIYFSLKSTLFSLVIQKNKMETWTNK